MKSRGILINSVVFSGCVIRMFIAVCVVLSLVCEGK